MLYALSRANGTIAVTTLVPHSVVISETTFRIIAVNGLGKTLLLLDPRTDEQQEIKFEVDFRDLDVDSLSQGTLVFPAIEDEVAKMPNEYVSWERITTADLPTTRTFRNAWTHDGKTVAVDMSMARNIHTDKMREARRPLLAALDIAYQRADEAGDMDEKKRIAAKKQVLRDVTDDPQLAKATTPEQLAAVWSDLLEAEL